MEYALKTNEKLELISLASNNGGDEIVEQFAAVLENKTLVVIDLGSNGIRKDGASKTLADSLGHNKNLLELRL